MNFIVRGVRNNGDFEFERQLEEKNDASVTVDF